MTSAVGVPGRGTGAWGQRKMSSPFIGQIMIFGGNFAPAGWTLCAGQLLPIADNAELFKAIGNV